MPTGLSPHLAQQRLLLTSGTSPRSISGVIGLRLSGPSSKVSLYDSSCRLRRYYPQWDWLSCAAVFSLFYFLLFSSIKHKDIEQTRETVYSLKSKMDVCSGEGVPRYLMSLVGRALHFLSQCPHSVYTVFQDLPKLTSLAPSDPHQLVDAEQP